MRVYTRSAPSPRVGRPKPRAPSPAGGIARPGLAWVLTAWLLAGVAGCAPTVPFNRWSSPQPLPQTTNAVPPIARPAAKAGKEVRPGRKPVTLATQPASDVVPPRYPVLTAVESSIGRVSTVNTQALFVVVDFGFNPLPRPHQRLTVFRTNEVVGTLRMTGAPRGSLMAADIMSGEARAGDEVR